MTRLDPPRSCSTVVTAMRNRPVQSRGCPGSRHRGNICTCDALHCDQSIWSPSLASLPRYMSHLWPAPSYAGSTQPIMNNGYNDHGLMSALAAPTSAATAVATSSPTTVICFVHPDHPTAPLVGKPATLAAGKALYRKVFGLPSNAKLYLCMRMNGREVEIRDDFAWSAVGHCAEVWNDATLDKSMKEEEKEPDCEKFLLSLEESVINVQLINV